MEKKQKAILLLSSGIDSPVAGILMQKKGVEIIALNAKLGEDVVHIKKVIENAKKIKATSLYQVDLTIAHNAFQKDCMSKLTCVFCKRTMIRAAEKLAQELDAEFIITGENIGQVASQTLDNLLVTSSAVDIEIMRPLLTKDKDEIMKLAREFGTYTTSTVRDCGCPYLPRSPSTKTTINSLEYEERKINMKELIKKIKFKKIF